MLGPEVSFEDMLRGGKKMILSPGTKSEISGYYLDRHTGRLDNDTVPSGWFIYEVSNDEKGNFKTLEPVAALNWKGTFITKTCIKMNSRGFHSLRQGAGWKFAEE